MKPEESTQEERVVEAVRRHLAGLRSKIVADFSAESCQQELEALRGDPVYSLFSFDCHEYVLIRLMGRVSISIGRRLGEIYDKIPRVLAAARFGLSQEAVAEKFENLELDISLRAAKLAKKEDRTKLEAAVKHALPGLQIGNGIAIEIRYNFNPNDSARLRKDVHLGELVKAAGLLPVYLIFSAISPRAEAIARLQRAGWHFLIGDAAAAFSKELLGLDLNRILTSPRIKNEVRVEVDAIMKDMVASEAFRRVVSRP